MAPTTWTTTIGELLAILRDALSALVAIADRARIPWREGDAYDDWDAMAAALYDGLVVRAIRHANQGGESVKLPEYDLVYPSYVAYDVIRVVSGAVPPGIVGAFIGFMGTETGFEQVKWVAMAEGGEIADPEVHACDYDDCKFALSRRADGGRTEACELTINL